MSGYNYIGPAGRIKGDVWGNCGSDAYHMQHYRNIDNTMRPYPEITANWAEAGIVPEKWVAFYCGTGWRASETWFYAYLQDWPHAAVYDGAGSSGARTRSTTRSRSASRRTCSRHRSRPGSPRAAPAVRCYRPLMALEIRPVREDEAASFVEARQHRVPPATGCGADRRRDLADVGRRPNWAAVDDGQICGTFRSWPTELTVPGLACLLAAAVYRP